MSSIYCRQNGRSSLCILDASTAYPIPLDVPFTDIGNVVSIRWSLWLSIFYDHQNYFHSSQLITDRFSELSFLFIVILLLRFLQRINFQWNWFVHSQVSGPSCLYIEGASAYCPLSVAKVIICTFACSLLYTPIKLNLGLIYGIWKHVLFFLFFFFLLLILTLFHAGEFRWKPFQGYQFFHYLVCISWLSQIPTIHQFTRSDWVFYRNIRSDCLCIFLSTC